MHAQNFLLNKAFKDMDYDVVFNVNLDDFYSPHRFEIQLEVKKKIRLWELNDILHAFVLQGLLVYV